MGREPRKVMEQFGRALDVQLPFANTSDLPRGQALLWSLTEGNAIRLTTEPPCTEHYRHRRKYAQGELENERRFRFRGPGNKMDLAV
jgi:hypothetical protein